MQSSSLRISYLKVGPIVIAVVAGYIVESGAVNRPGSFTPQAYELANKGNLTSFDVGELFPTLTAFRSVQTAARSTR